MYRNNEDKEFGLTRYAKFLVLFAGLVLGFILSRIFLFMPYTVQDNSMNPALKKGDHILILKITKPEEGDILLVKSPVEPGRVMVKRLVAKGEKILEIRDKRIYINNAPFTPSWQVISKDSRSFQEPFTGRDNLSPGQIHEGQIFVMGDNLDYSFDSREYGPIDENLVIGKLIYKL